jgi:anti-sigma factor ChrR (cupin superfamily)
MSVPRLPLLHPRSATLNRYADRTLERRATRRVSTHLIACARCRNEVAAISGLREAARAMTAPTASNDMLARVLTRRAAVMRSE